MVEFIVANFWLIMMFIAITLSDYRLGVMMAGVLIITGGVLNNFWIIFFMVAACVMGASNHKKVLSHYLHIDEKKSDET